MLAACSGRSSEFYIARAKPYIDAANYPLAITELQNALRQDSESAEARWLLGKVHLRTGDILAAENQLQRAQALGWRAEDVRPALATALLAQGRHAEVLALDHQGLAPEAGALLLSTQGIASAAQGDFEAARERVALALQLAPEGMDAKLAEATVAIQQGDTDGALARIDAIQAGAPDNGEAWWLRAHALLQAGQLEDALASVDKSIALLNHSVEAHLTRALINLQLGDYAAAAADSEVLAQLAPGNPSGQYVDGLILFERKEYRKAITALTRAKPMAARFPHILFYLSRAHLGEKDLDLAANFARQFVALDPDHSNGRKLLAAILMEQQKAGEARDILQPVLDNDPEDVTALNIMANALLLDDRADVGIELYVRLRQLQPDWRIAPLLQETALVGADVAAGPADTAALAQTRPNFPQNQILRIMDHLAQKDFPGAIEAAKSYQFQDLESLAPYRVLGMVYLAAGQPDDARDTFEKALQRQPDDVLTNLSMARMALEAGDPGEARGIYQRVLDQHPDDLTALLQLGALEAKEQNPAALVQRLQQAVAAHPNALEPRYKLAAHYLTSGSPQKVEQQFAKLGALQRASPRVLELIALAQLAQGQNEGALATARQWVAASPDSAESRVLLAKALSETGDAQRARQALLEAVERDPKHVPALINLATIAQRQGAREELERHLAVLVDLAPEDPDVLRLRALSARARGDAGEALALSQRAAAAAPSSQAVLQLSALQQEMGDKAAARALLEQWTRQHPSDVPVRLALAFALALGNDMKGAQAQYRAVLEQDPANVDALNHLAWNLRVEHPAQALDYSRRAAALAPERPDILDTLAVIEHLTGDNASARRTIRRALQQAPRDPSLRYHQAMIEAAVGETGSAIAALEALLAEQGDEFPERADAASLLRSLKG